MTLHIAREPALAAIAVLAPAVQLTVAFIVGDAALQGTINALAAFLAGLLVAVVVRSDKLAPAILGFAQGLLALALQLGLDLSAEKQAAAMAFVGVLVATYVRTQVTAPIPAGPAPDPTPKVN